MILSLLLGGTKYKEEALVLIFSIVLRCHYVTFIRFPEMYTISYSIFRRCVIRRFPFSIFYTIENEEIVIHSVFDNRQDTKKRP